jgi:TonB family protein
MRAAAIFLAAAGLSSPSILLAQTTPTPEASASPIIERNKLVMRKFYPASSLRLGEEGTVSFTIIVNRDGRIDGCQVTKSSGYEALDKATCDMMLVGATGQVQRAANRRVAYSRDGLVDWKLPDDVVRPATVPPFNVARSSSGEPLICRRQTKTGSSYITEKVCLTRADWWRQEAYAQEQTQNMQAAKGPVGLPN